MALSFDNVSFHYGETEVLRDFSLTLPGRGVVCFLGESGCGKTTLLRLLLGLEAPERGAVTGRDGLRFAAVFQEDRLLPWLTVRDNLAVPLRGEKAAAAVEKALRLVGLEHAGELYPDELSGGMKRRAAIARALAYGGDVLVLDEPFTGIDEARWQELACLLRKEYEEKLILLVTHVRAEWEAFEAKTYAFAPGPLSGRWE